MSSLINFTDQTVFKVPVSGTYTVPEVVAVLSPTAVAGFASRRATVGGQLICGYDDVAGNVVQLDAPGEQLKLQPLDVIACSAVGATVANQVDITITSRDGTVRNLILAGVTAVAGVIGVVA